MNMNKKKGSSKLQYARYKRATNTISKLQADGSLSIINLDCFESYFRLDGWALHYWKMLDGKLSQAEIIRQICISSKLDGALVEQQVKVLTSKLFKFDLLEKVVT